MSAYIGAVQHDPDTPVAMEVGARDRAQLDDVAQLVEALGGRVRGKLQRSLLLDVLIAPRHIAKLRERGARVSTFDTHAYQLPPFDRDIPQ